MSVPLSILNLAQQPGASRPPAAPEHVHADAFLRDSHGRVIHDLRFSITDRCNFRCTYCLEPGAEFLGRTELLSGLEIVHLVRVCKKVGIRKVRLTGGEPTLRPDLLDLIRELSALGLDDLAMTTNGSLCDQPTLAAWKAAGLRRVSFSLDSLDPAVFAAMTRSRTEPSRVVESIAAAVRAGLGPVKVNAVVVRGQNEDQVPLLAALAREHEIEMRFIEFMPLDDARAWDPQQVVPASEIVERIEAVYPLVPTGRDEPSSTALTYVFADGAGGGGGGGGGRIGVIAPVTRSFCGACSRLRITADGKVRPCLFSTREWDVRGPLRAGASDDELVRLLKDAAWTKQAGHGISTKEFERPERSMSAIGG